MKHQAHYLPHLFAEGLKRLFALLFLLSLMWLITPISVQASTEVEPNDTCQTAQDFTGASLPFSLSGQITPIPGVGTEEDYFKFEGTSGALVKIDVKSADPTTLNPYLYVFDESCNQSIKYTGSSPLILTVPQNGKFIVYTWASGSQNYTLTITPTNAIGSITGNVIDAITGQPIANNAIAFLYRCYDSTCSDLNPVASQVPNSQGIVTFTQEDDLTSLAVGNYKIIGYSDQYEAGETPQFFVAKNQNKQVDVPLKSYPARVSVKGCNNIPGTGGKCKFSVTVTNGKAKALDAMVWSVVNGYGVNILGQSTQFQLQQDYDILLPKLGNTKTLNFEFNVPAGVRDNAYFYVNTYVGGVKRNPNFNIKGEYGFSLEKLPNNTALTIMPERRAAKLRHHHRN
ncbi:carboxypeptidase-like regulatory domain-containing protein [Crenothrix sp.]|uniref:carboxypeptidase-like regulatory domain-containing protein n=1 Tax=Crenothrix sp. TaxID=3100433 RepID=UPI00374DBDB3